MGNEHEPEHRVVDVEVFSHNKINRSVVVFLMPFSLGVVGVLVAAVIPHLAEVWLLIEFLGFVLASCIAVLAIGACIFLCYRFRIKARHEERAGRIITWEAGCAWINDAGEIEHLSAEHEQAKLPQLALPSPALSEEARIEMERTKVLALHEEGLGMHKIEHLEQIPFSRVRDYINTMKKAQEVREKYIKGDE